MYPIFAAFAHKLLEVMHRRCINRIHTPHADNQALRILGNMNTKKLVCRCKKHRSTDFIDHRMIRNGS